MVGGLSPPGWCDIIEKASVVAHNQHRPLPVGHHVLEIIGGRVIKMIGGFIEQENIGVRQEHAGQ